MPSSGVKKKNNKIKINLLSFGILATPFVWFLSGSWNYVKQKEAKGRSIVSKSYSVFLAIF